MKKVIKKILIITVTILTFSLTSFSQTDPHLDSSLYIQTIERVMIENPEIAILSYEQLDEIYRFAMKWKGREESINIEDRRPGKWLWWYHEMTGIWLGH